MAGSPLTLSYPELCRVTGTLQSLVLRTEDMWQRYNQCLEVGGALNETLDFERPESTGSKIMFSLSSVILFNMIGVDSCVFFIFTTRVGRRHPD
jgi:hypothetical protein